MKGFATQSSCPHTLFVVVVLLSFVLSTQCAPQSALVTKLPGFDGKFPSKHYSGYIPIGKNGEKKLYYYFVESERNPSKDPVVLWLNGGPGCSSMDGFVYEHGPFNFEARKPIKSLPKLHPNPYSWSKVSNIIYLDSPAGVGYSYALNDTDYQTGDQRTASDTHTFLLKWFTLYNEFQSNSFYISGESYAGVYIPTLAYEIVKGLHSGVKPTINLKGYAVGNGVTDELFDGNAFVPFAHGMGLISDEIYEGATKGCGGNYYSGSSKECIKYINKFTDATYDLNVYNILEPCYHGQNGNAFVDNKVKLPASFKDLGKTERPLPVRKRMFGRAWPYRAPVRPGRAMLWPELQNKFGGPPCFDAEVGTYWLNNAEVRKALHAAEEKIAGEWELCTGRLVYYMDAGSMIEYHKKLTSLGYAALIYSGDHDFCVPYTGSQAWTESLGYKILDEWRPWYSNDQVAGFLQGYEKNLTFLTVKGSGHTVPEYKPREALDFYSRWLAGKPI